MNETVRSREARVRDLLECERESGRIAGELGGSDVLGQLDGMEHNRGSFGATSSGRTDKD